MSPALCAVIVSLLTGCGLTPVYVPPPLPIPEIYPSDTLGDIPAEQTISNFSGWEDYFIGEPLRSLIAKALEHNRDLRMMASRVEEARIAYGIRRAERYPQLTAGAVAPRFDLPAEISLSRSDEPSSLYVAGFTGAWELDFWGRINNLSEAALMEYLATDSARQAARLSLIVRVADAYLSRRDLDERILIADQAITTRQRTFDLFSRRFQIGSGTRFELSQAETLLTHAQSLSAQLRQSLALQMHTLHELTGAEQIQTDAETELQDDLLIQDLKAGLPSDLLTRRPDIMATENKLKAANANIGAARAAFFPRITLNAAFGGISSELNGLFDPVSRAWLFIPNISIPILDAGRTQANLDISEVRKNIAVANYEKTIQIAFREVSDNLSSRRWLSEQILIQRRAVAAQKERLRLSGLRYASGSSAYFEVLDAERDLLAVQQQLSQLRRSLLSTQVNLYAALGGASQVAHTGDDAR